MFAYPKAECIFDSLCGHFEDRDRGLASKSVSIFKSGQEGFDLEQLVLSGYSITPLHPAHLCNFLPILQCILINVHSIICTYLHWHMKEPCPFARDFQAVTHSLRFAAFCRPTSPFKAEYSTLCQTDPEVMAGLKEPLIVKAMQASIFLTVTNIELHFR
jgi:hypothetical protein